MSFNYFSLHIENHIAHLAFNRPEKANSLHVAAWTEMQEVFEHLKSNKDVRVILLKGEGKVFCAGIDLQTLMTAQNAEETNEGKRREQIREFVLQLQGNITAIEKCGKPVIAVVHGPCIGGGVDIISACDMRFCSADATFSIKEIDLGLVADIGTLQRMPTLVNPGLMAELSLTGRNFDGQEAQQIGFVNKVYATKEELYTETQKLAENIASKSPLVTRGIKEVLLYKRDHTVQDSLNYIATWNAAMLISDDLMESFSAYMEKRKPVYKD